MNNIKKSVSIYYNAKDANSQETITIDEVIELIRKDSCIISELTEKVRNAVDEKEYKELKKQLPMFTVAAMHPSQFPALCLLACNETLFPLERIH